MKDLFPNAPEEAVVRTRDAFVGALARATALEAVALARDDTIPPDAFALGLLQAHLRGAASAITAMKELRPPIGPLVGACASSILNQLMEAGQ